MTESKPSQNRIICPTVPTCPVALGHSYASPASYLTRPKVNQVTQPSSASTNLPPAMITHSSQTSAGTAQIQVSLPLAVSSKEQLTVVPSYSYVSKSNSTSQSNIRTPAHPSHPMVDKISVAVTTTSAETLVKANVKNVGTRVNYVKQLTATTTKSIISGSPTPSIVQAPIKKDAEPGKGRHFLVGPGLRQPLKPNPPQPVAKANVPTEMARVVSRSAPINSSSWGSNQQDSIKPIIPPPSLARGKLPFQNPAPHDLSKKHTISQQPKTTISITPSTHIPSREAVQRSTTLPVAPISTGNKIYQVLTPNMQNVQVDAAKKIPLIVSQAIALPVSNSPNTTTGFIPPSSALSTGQITVMTCGAGITYVPAPTPPNGASNSIPIAKVYPQQQSTSRPSVVSTTIGRLSVPVISSVNASSSQRTTSALIQVGPFKSTSASSIVMTQTTVMSTIPTTITKNVGSVLCWQTYNLPASTATSTSNLRPGAPGQQSIPIPGTIRVQPHAGNVLLVESKPSLAQVADGRSLNSSHNSTNQPAIGPGTPTMSPKPAILRRPRPENSTALKKLSFPTSTSNYQRRDTHSQANERRPAPYMMARPKVSEGTKPNMPVVIQHGGNIGEKNEVKPVLEDQAFQKPLTASNSVPPLKFATSVKSPPMFSNSGKDGGGQSYSIHPVADLKVKVESANRLETVKSEPGSVSQMLQFQSMHTYAAENPQNAPQQRVISQASGHYAQTHTIFTKPSSHTIYQSPQTTRPTKVIKSAANTLSNQHSQVDSTVHQSSHGVNSFPQHRTGSFTSDRNPSAFDYVKKEQSRTKPVTGLDQGKQLGGTTLMQNHGPPNHLISAISPAKSWSNVNHNVDPLAGLSPRKRPRKQTHIVSEDQPVVMEDEESTDDADECEDEPMPEVAPMHPSISTTPSIKLPGHKPSTSHRLIKSEPQNKKIVVKEENIHKVPHVKSEVTPFETKPPSEYTDPDGVRYVLSRKRPAVSVLNRLKHNSRSVANHFMHYTDVRVKDKKTTIADLANDKRRLKGMKVARLALQLHDMVECEKDVWKRMQDIHDGLVKYKSTLVGEQTFDNNLVSPSPGTPSSISSSFRKATPRSSRSSSMSAVNENGAMQSPSTPLDRKAHKVKDEILVIEELAQANLQRCRVVSDQLTDTKTMLLKSVDHRQLVADILDSPTNQKTPTQAPVNSQATKRLPKKKNNS